MSRGVAGRLLPAAVAMAALLAGCTTGPPEPAVATGGTGGATTDVAVSADVVQYRRDQARRVVQVQVTNHGEQPVRVTAVTLDSPGFASVPPTEKDSTLEPGRAVDLPVPLGEVRCEGVTDAAAAERAAVTLTLVRGTGTVGPSVGFDPDDATTLSRVHRRECAEQQVRAVADVGWDDAGWQVSGSGTATRMTGVLDVVPTGDVPLQVGDVGGTTLFAVVAQGTPATVRPGAPLRIPVELLPQRCDGHAIGESKRGYAFSVRVAAGDEPEALVTVEPSADWQDRLGDALLARCGIS